MREKIVPCCESSGQLPRVNSKASRHTFPCCESGEHLFRYGMGCLKTYWKSKNANGYFCSQIDFLEVNCPTGKYPPGHILSSVELCSRLNYNLAVLLHQKGNRLEAIKELEAGLEIDPNSVKIRQFLHGLRQEKMRSQEITP